MNSDSLDLVEKLQTYLHNSVVMVGKIFIENV